MRNKQGNLVSFSTKIYPKITMTDGIILIAIFNPTISIEFFNREILIEDIYLIVTDHKN
jgi:hypothetical protein